MSSRLFVRLRERNGLVYNVSIDKSEYEASGIFCILRQVLIIKNSSHTKKIILKKMAHFLNNR